MGRDGCRGKRGMGWNIMRFVLFFISHLTPRYSSLESCSVCLYRFCVVLVCG
jgi:hypothetical protein